MLGEGLEDPANVDGRAAGLCLLPLRTQFESDKITRVTTARFMSLPDPWSALSGLAFRGYEIRHGRSAPAAPLAEAIAGGLGYVRGSVLGSYVHGMLEFPDIARALFGKKASPTLDETFESLADAIDAALDMRSLEGSLAPHVVRGGDRLGELSPRTSPMSRP